MAGESADLGFKVPEDVDEDLEEEEEEEDSGMDLDCVSLFEPRPRQIGAFSEKLWSQWVAFFDGKEHRESGKLELWCCQAVGYEGLWGDKCSFLFLVRRKLEIAEVLLGSTALVRDCIISTNMPSTPYRKFICRHKELSRVMEPARTDPEAFMAALAKEEPEKVINVLCTYDGDDEAQGKYAELVQLAQSSFLDLDRCQRIGGARRTCVARLLRAKGWPQTLSESVAGFLYPSSPAVILAIAQDEGLQPFQFCASCEYMSAETKFVLAQSRGQALRRIFTAAGDCERMLKETGVLTPNSRLPGDMPPSFDVREERKKHCATRSDAELDRAFGYCYEKDHFQVLSVEPLLPERQFARSVD